MAPQPRAISLRHHRHLFLLLAVTAVATGAATADMDAAAPSATETRSTASAPAASFLRACCATTLYPALCYDSLLPYAPEFQTSHARLARAAADVTAAHLRALSTRVKDLLLHATRPDTAAGGRPSEAAALHDCASTISSAANLARQSSAELAGLDAAESTTPAGASSRQARWQVSNAKTWLSAAMTNEGTCTDGLEEAGAAASLAGKEVTAGVASVRQYTSNSLALVNGIPL